MWKGWGCGQGCGLCLVHEGDLNDVEGMGLRRVAGGWVLGRHLGCAAALGFAERMWQGWVSGQGCTSVLVHGVLKECGRDGSVAGRLGCARHNGLLKDCGGSGAVGGAALRFIFALGS
jgi:hypothetical protein